MTALTKNTDRDKKTPGLIAPQITDTTVMYSGGFVAGGHAGHGTSASRGRCFPWTGAQYQIPLGFSLNKRTGDTSPADGGPNVELEIASESAVVDVPVTGLAGDVTDVFKRVFPGTDNNTFTFTRPTRGIACGIVIRYISASLARVRFFGFAEMALLAMAGAGQYTWPLGVISGVQSAAGPVDALTGIECPHKGTITKVYGIVIEPLVGSGADLDINLEIGGTNVTGGVIEWLLANVRGTKKSGTAITAANVFTEGDLIDVEVTRNTASTGGLMGIYAEVQTDLGL